MKISKKLREIGVNPQTVANQNTNQNTGLFRNTNLFSFTENADFIVGEILRAVISVTRRDLFNKIYPKSGEDVGASGTDVLIHLYKKEDVK